MKKFFKIVFVILILLAAVGAWMFLGSGTGFPEKRRFLYISTKAATKGAVLDSLQTNNLVSNTTAFSFLANRLDYWENIKPGKYEIAKGSSLLTIVRMLRNGRRSAGGFGDNQVQNKEDFARFSGARFEFDSTEMIAFLNDADSMANFSVDTATVFCNILPDTYRYFWNTPPAAVYRKFYQAQQNFWNEERKQKAQLLGLSQNEVYTLASIIEEETTNHSEKDTIASVYLNRLTKGMPLQADPTLKFAVRNFALKRISGDILHTESPYNTYNRKGLPPGPICTPSKITIDAVLNPATTPYYYFVANNRLNGHLFSANFEEHVQKATAYRLQDKARRERDSLSKAGQ